MSGRGTDAAATMTAKRCPACAEVVQRDANRCRFCGHSFTPSRFSPPRWFLVTVFLIVTVFAVAAGFHVHLGSSHHGADKIDTTRLETEIKPKLQRQLRGLANDGSLVVTDVSCIATSDTQATCLAKATDAAHDHLSFGVHADIDPRNGTAIWRVET